MGLLRLVQDTLEEAILPETEITILKTFITISL